MFGWPKCSSHSPLNSLYLRWRTFAFTLSCLVGPSGLEPPTSCLSGTRSNHLSYEPLFPFCTISMTFRISPIQSSSPFFGGDDGIRTHDPLLAGQVLSQLSYTPKFFTGPSLFQRSFKIEQRSYKAFSPSIGIYLVLRYFRFSIERRWSSRTFRYGYLVTT